MTFRSKLAGMAKISFLLLLFAAALAVTACASSEPESKTITLELSNAGLSPSAITIAAGQPVELQVDNRTGAAHELAVADIPLVTTGSAEHNMAGMSDSMGDMAAMPPIHMMVGAGEKQSLRFTPSKAGRYEFTCLTPGHEEHGVLTVTNG